MNRRDLLKSAIALPLLGFVPKAEATLNLKVEITKEKALESWILGKCEELKIRPTEWQLTQLIRMFGEEHFVEVETNEYLDLIKLHRGWYGKSYLLAMYTVLLADSPILVGDDQIKILITASTQAQCNRVYKYTKEILMNRRRSGEVWATWNGTTACKYISYNNTELIFKSLGNGDEVRRFRPNILLVDDFSSINKEVLNEIVLPGLLAIGSSGKVVFCG